MVMVELNVATNTMPDAVFMHKSKALEGDVCYAHSNMSWSNTDL